MHFWYLDHESAVSDISSVCASRVGQQLMMKKSCHQGRSIKR